MIALRKMKERDFVPTGSQQLGKLVHLKHDFAAVVDLVDKKKLHKKKSIVSASRSSTQTSIHAPPTLLIVLLGVLEVAPTVY